MKLAHRCCYTPDFVVTLPDGSIEYHEVKGPHCWEDSRVKFKLASRILPRERFVWARWSARKGEWRVERWRAGMKEKGEG